MHSLQCYLFAITPSQDSAERKKKTLFPVMGWVYVSEWDTFEARGADL